MIKRAIDQALTKARERNWDTITIAVDWHDTICKSTYGETALEFYEGALVALRKLSKQEDIKLILFTSSYDVPVAEFLTICEEQHEIFFDYVNCNPEVENTEYGDFSRKFYYDILVDDKAGFDPLTEWVDLLYVEI